MVLVVYESVRGIGRIFPLSIFPVFFFTGIKTRSSQEFSIPNPFVLALQSR